MNNLDFKSPYLQEQIITYLGNKRKLIPFIDSVVEQLIQEDEELQKKQYKDISFFDIFAGSGIVSRYSKLKGFTTYSNDLELYSSLIQDVIINTNLDDLENIFSPIVSKLKLNNNINDSYQIILDYLNNLNKPLKEENLYWALHYAPKNTSKPDFDNERLFYTQENALKIDAIVEEIFNTNVWTEQARNIISVGLMYNMTWHINTSGTMKGFHNGWGGRNKNALERILGEIILKKIPFINNEKGFVFNDYAEKVFINNEIPKIDIIYADPPYNQHQYSANYNHLTTLVKNDKYNPGEVVQGSRAGIRVDHNRSDFCKSVKNDEQKKLAHSAFEDFIKNVNCKYIIMSYNNEGVIDIDTLLNVLSEELKNTITIQYKLYDKYKGGKNTQTSNKVIEYLIIVHKDKKQQLKDFEEMKLTLLKETKNHLFLDKYIDYDSFEHKKINDNIVELIDADNKTLLSIDKDTYKVKNEQLNQITLNEMEILLKYEMDNIQLMKKYIHNKNILAAQKLLSVFKIKKYQDLQKEFKEQIEKLTEES